MKARSLISWATLLLCLAALLLNTGTAAYRHIMRKRQRSAAAAMAQQYMEEKYGFHDPTDSGNEHLRLSLLHDGIYAFAAQHEGRDYQIWVNPAGTPRCIDNYQLEDITAAVRGLMQTRFQHFYITDLFTAEQNDWDCARRLNGGFSAPFDGNDLEGLMQKGNGRLTACVAEDDPADRRFIDRLTALHLSCCLTGMDTAAHLDEFMQLNADTPLDPYMAYKYAAPHINSHFDNLDGTEKSIAIDVKQAEDFCYAYLPTENKGFPVSEPIAPPVRLTPADFSDFFYFKGSAHSAAYNERAFVDTPVSAPWQFDCRYGDIMIYYPLEKLEGCDLHQIGGAWYSASSIANNRDIEALTVFGDYAVLRLPFSDMCFMLVDLTQKEPYTPGWAKK